VGSVVVGIWLLHFKAGGHDERRLSVAVVFSVFILCHSLFVNDEFDVLG